MTASDKSRERLEFERHVMVCLRIASDGRKKDVALLPTYKDLMAFIDAHTAAAVEEAEERVFFGGYAGYGGLERTLMSDGPEALEEHVGKRIDELRKRKRARARGTFYDNQ